MFNDITVSDDRLEPTLPPLNESYLTIEFQFVNRQIIQEVNTITMQEFILQCDPLKYSLMTEVSQRTKDALINALQRLADIIKKLTTKFQNIALKLVARNRNWLNNVKTKLDENSVSDDYSYEIYPYWRSKSKLIGYRIPEFSDTNSQLLEDLSSESSFKEKYFNDLYVTVDGERKFDPKQVLRGSDRKIRLAKTSFLSQLDDMIDLIERYSDYARQIADRNGRFIDILNRAISKIKTTPLQEGSDDHIMQTLTTLLEDGGEEPATTTEIKKDEGEDGREGEQSADLNIRKISSSRQIYTKVCYSVNSARMAILEEAYNNYIKAILNAQKKSRKSNRD